MTDPVPHFADFTRRQAAERPTASATWFEGRETSFQRLDAYATQVANGLLSLDQQTGNRIGFLAKNTDRFFEVFYGCAKARMALVPVNTRLAVPEFEYILNDCETDTLFVGREFYDAAEELRARLPGLRHIIALEEEHPTFTHYETWRNAQSAIDPMLTTQGDDDVLQLYTSGTTGFPKGVRLTNDNSGYYIANTRHMEAWQYEPGAAVLCSMPLFHLSGVNGALFAGLTGAELVVLRDVDLPVILNLIERKTIAHSFFVPAVLQTLLQLPQSRETDFSSLKTITYGGSPITEDVLELSREIMGNVRFVQVFGMTETAGGGTMLLPEDHDPARGLLRSCGKPVPGVELRVMGYDGTPAKPGEVGEVIMRAPCNMKGYWNRDEATASAFKDGFYLTGDAGYLNEDGYLFLVDRIKDMIVSGGENVYPAEVENAIATHPDVVEAAVIGIPSEKWGEEVKAVVVLVEHSTIDATAIIDWASTRIARYKCPKSVDFTDMLPRNSGGKVLRRTLRKPYWDGVGRNVT